MPFERNGQFHSFILRYSHPLRYLQKTGQNPKKTKLNIMEEINTNEKGFLSQTLPKTSTTIQDEADTEDIQPRFDNKVKFA